MSRKRTSLSRSIADLAASMPALNPGDHCDHVVEPDEMVTGDYTDHENEFISIPPSDAEPAIPVSVHPVLEQIYEQLEKAVLSPVSAEPPVSPDGETPPTDLELPPTANELFRRWYLTPEGRRVTDTRIPTDPIRLGSTLDDNARIAFMAGYAAANQ